VHIDKKPETNLFSDYKLFPRLCLEKVAPAGQLNTDKTGNTKLQAPKYK
jgi:hypothetical protein